MKLHLNPALFRQAIRRTSENLELLPIYIEKDYWVTYVLFTVFTHDIGQKTIFKGGTALSKCYNLINRFSEDIDLIVQRNDGESETEIKNKVKQINSLVNTILPEVAIPGVTQKKGRHRKTVHEYPKEFKGNYGQIRDVIVVEATSLGYHEPFTKRMVNSFVGEMMLNNGQQGIATEYELIPFEVNSLEPTRTLCEKIMSLVRFSYGENPLDDLRNKIRHMYDLHQLLQSKEYVDFLSSDMFEEMLIRVDNEDLVSFRSNNDWLRNHPREALIFKDLNKTWIDLEKTYNGDFKRLVYKDFPDGNLIIEAV